MNEPNELHDSKPISANEESLRMQLQTLQSRITTHGNRIWQLPFTYVSFTAITVSLISKDGPISVREDVFYFILSFAGVIVLWAIFDAWRSYTRTADNMNQVERLLGLGEYTSRSPRHVLPHVSLCLFIVTVLAIAGFKSTM